MLSTKRIPFFVPMGLSVVVVVLLSTAWFQIQSTRWGYRLQEMHKRLDDLEKREQFVDQRLQGALSLSRLDGLAKTKYGLAVPDPAQVVLLPEA